MFFQASGAMYSGVPAKVLVLLSTSVGLAVFQWYKAYVLEFQVPGSYFFMLCTVLGHFDGLFK